MEAEMTLRPMTAAEQMYSYSQSQQISMQTGLIGYLRADMDNSGKGFFSSWNGFRDSLKSEDFKQEFDEVLNELREDGNLLHDRNTLGRYCHRTPDSSFHNDRNEYGFRADTDHYSYLMRVNPNKGEYNLYCYCYVRQWLDRHMRQAEKGIRFITSDYKEVFRIPDGDRIRMTLPSGENLEQTCRYIDDTHLEVGNNLYEGRHPSPVPIWAVHSEQEQAIVETLENSFGVLENTDTLGNALISAASNVMEDNFQDYLAQLVYYKEGSFLEPLDEESLEAIFKPLLQNSIGYMLLVRCGIDPSKHFTPEDFSYISGFNTLPTINALGTATSDISQMCLSEIARTVLSLQRQQNRTFEDAAQKEYAVPENQPERSMNHDTDHIHEAGGLSASQHRTVLPPGQNASDVPR